MKYILAVLIALSFFLTGMSINAEAAPAKKPNVTETSKNSPNSKAPIVSVDTATFETSDGLTAVVTTFADGTYMVQVGEKKYLGEGAKVFLTNHGIQLAVNPAGHINPKQTSVHSGAKIVVAPAKVSAPAPKAELAAGATTTPPQAVEIAKFKSNDKTITVTTYDDSSVTVNTEQDQFVGAPAMRYLSQNGIAVQTSDTGHITAMDVTNGATVVVPPLAATNASGAKAVEVAKFMTGDQKTVTVTTYDDNTVQVSVDNNQLTGSDATNFLTSKGIDMQVQGEGHIGETNVSMGSKILTDPLPVSRPSADTSADVAATSGSDTGSINSTAAQAAEVAKFMTDDKQVVDVTTFEDGSVAVQVGDRSLSGEEALSFLQDHSIDMAVTSDGHITNTDVTNDAKVLVPPLAAALAANSADKSEDSQNEASTQQEQQEAAQQQQQTSESEGSSSSQSQSQFWTPTVVLPSNVATGSAAQVQQAIVEGKSNGSENNNINERPISK